MPRQKSTHVDDPRAVGERLKQARVAAGLSQRQLAFPGCSPAYISRIEAGDRIPSLQLLRELGRRLGVSEDYLATGEELQAQHFALLEAEIALRLDDVERAHDLYSEAIGSATTARERSLSEEGLGHLAFRRGDLREAIRLFEQALVSSGDKEWDRPALSESLGRAYASLGELDPCVAIFERCLKAFKRVGNHVESVRFSCLLGYALSENGEFARAEEIVSNALAAGGDSLDPYTRARVYWSQAKLRGDQGDTEGGSRYAYRALAALQLTEDLHYTALAHRLVARSELERGNPQEALEHLREGRPIIERTGSPIDRADFLIEQARAYAQLGQREQAEELAAQITGLLANVQAKDMIGRINAVLGDIALDVGDRKEALACYMKAAENLEAGAPDRDLVGVYAKLADLFESEGRSEEAYAYMKKAVGMQQSVAPKRSA
jgi:tetratricopeptide (TPR) repeat protein